MRMKRDLHLKKIYVATLLTALTVLPTAFAIGVFLESNMKSNCKTSQATSITHLQADSSSENVSN